jgi:hypothetical protein
VIVQYREGDSEDVKAYKAKVENKVLLEVQEEEATEDQDNTQ